MDGCRPDSSETGSSGRNTDQQGRSPLEVHEILKTREHTFSAATEFSSYGVKFTPCRGQCKAYVPLKLPEALNGAKA